MSTQDRIGHRLQRQGAPGSRPIPQAWWISPGTFAGEPARVTSGGSWSASTDRYASAAANLTVIAGRNAGAKWQSCGNTSTGLDLAVASTGRVIGLRRDAAGDRRRRSDVESRWRSQFRKDPLDHERRSRLFRFGRRPARRNITVPAPGPTGDVSQSAPASRRHHARSI